MNRPKQPLGVDNFEEIRTQNYYYVDKTLMIRDLLRASGKVTLFTRPRRFGKTLNMSMLKSFFEIAVSEQTGKIINKKELFEGLAIMGEKELCAKHLGQYPVVFISLKGVIGETFQQAVTRLTQIIRDETLRLQYLWDSSKLSEFDKILLKELLTGKLNADTLQESLKRLTRLLEKHHGKKVVLLIDEYDVPLDKAYEFGYYQEMITLIRGLFSQSLKTNEHLQLAVLTGCLRVSKESIFTGLNNLKVNSITDEQFDEYFGFTDAEVQAMLSYYGLQQHYRETKEWYDGYRFGEQDVYCPWDVIYYCSDLLELNSPQPQAYWLNSSGNSIVRRLIEKAGTVKVRREIAQLISGESLLKKLNLQLTHNEIELNINNLWSLLFTTGYLTTVGKMADGSYKLVIPNKEIRQIFQEQIEEWLAANARADTDRLNSLYEAFASGNTPVIRELLNNELLISISFHDAYESFYHGFLLALLNSCSTWEATSNVETGHGLCDILVEGNDNQLGMIIEVKRLKVLPTGKARKTENTLADGNSLKEKLLTELCEKALTQIVKNDYPAILRKSCFSQIWIYGIAFCGKQCQVAARLLSSSGAF